MRKFKHNAVSRPVKIVHSANAERGGDEPIHISLEDLLPAEQQVVVDLKNRIVTLLYSDPLGRSKILTQQILSPKAIRVFIPLLKSPDYCPYEALRASIECPEEVLQKVLILPAIKSFEELQPFIDDYSQSLQDAQRQGSEAWEWEVRPIRRAIGDLMNSLLPFGLGVFSLRSSGYRLGRAIVANKTVI